MEFHESKLALLYRLCGEQITLSRGYAEARAASELKQFIQHAYTIDIEQNLSNIHPPSVCNKCYMKLYRLHKKPITDIVSRISFCFSQHDVSCLICENSKEQIWWKGKADLEPYRSGIDPRFEVCVRLYHLFICSILCVFIDVYCCIRAVYVRWAIPCLHWSIMLVWKTNITQASLLL